MQLEPMLFLKKSMQLYSFAMSQMRPHWNNCYLNFMGKIPLVRKRRASSVISEPPRNIGANHNSNGHNSSDQPFIPVIIAANKCEQKSQRVISHEQIQQFVETKLRPIIDRRFLEDSTVNNHVHINSANATNTLADSTYKSTEWNGADDNLLVPLQQTISINTSDHIASTNAAVNSPKHRFNNVDFGRSITPGLKSRPLSLSNIYGHDMEPLRLHSARSSPNAGSIRRRDNGVLWNAPSLNVLHTQKDTKWSDDDDHLDDPTKHSFNKKTKWQSLINDKKHHIAHANTEIITTNILTDDDFNQHLPQNDDASTDPVSVSIVECSAATGRNVDRVFEKCVHKVKANIFLN
ncbi:hypothetical protein RFI_11283 [Reticulomyxa filosa]|uniref:Uncharacterized protein n=1 Tax=Reticulomyxa filosa TaxID=46433 RepID=X6NHP8_RETFI|nr:hypothetical protein RFI_11283 [Reticulomyxa filosa]|eukprot:ETO25850.1 hypothetical protein RFI_11283 [Reticulomyxa filosa]